MRNLFQEGTYQAGVGIASPTIGGFRPLQAGHSAKQMGFNGSDMFPKLVTAGNSLQPASPSGNALPASAVPPGAADRMQRPDVKKDRFNWAVGRLCTIMRRLEASNANPQAISRVFWAFVRHARSSEESVLTAYQTMCPELVLPEKPTRKILPVGNPVLVKLTYQEAVEIAPALDKALSRISVEDVVAASDAESSGAFAPEDLPKAEILREEIAAFVSAGDTGATLEVDQEDVASASKAISQSEGSGNTKNLLLAGAAVLGVGALVYVLVR